MSRHERQRNSVLQCSKTEQGLLFSQQQRLYGLGVRLCSVHCHQRSCVAVRYVPLVNRVAQTPHTTELNNRLSCPYTTVLFFFKYRKRAPWTLANTTILCLFFLPQQERQRQTGFERLETPRVVSGVEGKCFLLREQSSLFSFGTLQN